MLYGIILAGGSGTRLWPESRANRPKQFFKFDGKTTILAETIQRVQPLIPMNRMLVATGGGMVPAVTEAIPLFPKANILTEPFSRNTAPAIGLAALEVIARNPHGVMAVLPSDHFIEPADKFRDTLAAAFALVEEDPERIVTIGIAPTRPATGFGYIRTGEALNSPAALERRQTATAFSVAAFHEKPNRETAERYLSQGGYLWNAGIFVWKASRVLELFNLYQPDIGEKLETIKKSLYHDDSEDVLRENYGAMTPISIDLAIMEKADRIVTLAAPLAWNDIGSFESIGELHAAEKDADGNVAQGIRLMTVDGHNNIVRWNVEDSDAEKELIAIVGLDGVEVVRQGNAILIAKKGNDGKIRELVERLKSERLDEFL